MIVEGQTEEQFVKSVLYPHLLARGVLAQPIIVTTSRDADGTAHKGGGHWHSWRGDIARVLGEQTQQAVRVTTLFDLYGLPPDFPGLGEHGANADTKKRAALLEKAMADAVGDWRFVPYIQRHEFEALVLAALDRLEPYLEADATKGFQELKKAIEGQAPEDVNDGSETAPSKRLKTAIPGYQKPLYGPFAIEDAGLAAIRARCERFAGWVAQIEALGPPA